MQISLHQILIHRVTSPSEERRQRTPCNLRDMEACVPLHYIVSRPLSVSNCHATRRLHEGWDTARLPNPRQGKSRGRGRVQTTDLPCPGGSPQTKNSSAVALFQCLTAMPPKGCTRAGILPGCPILDRGGREAEFGFEPRTFRLSPMESSVICAPQDPQVYFQVHWKIKRRQVVTPSTVVCTLGGRGSAPLSIYAPGFGWATALLQDESIVAAGCDLFRFEPCRHHIVMKDLCAECGANLRREGGLSGERIEDASAKIPMVHAVPDLHVSESVAAELALQDEQSLLAARKLVLLVDLDETVLHTTNDPQAYRYKNVSRYCLPGSPLVYHTSFRPHLKAVLDRLSKYYQMHICTFGNRMYAHQLAGMIDPKRRYFSHRILSRDECFNPVTKSANLKALFPRGLNLVCIIDDRGEVWEWSPHLIQVKPYRFFQDACDTKHFAWSSPTGRQEKLSSVSESVAVSSAPVTSETTESVKTNGTEQPVACSTQLPSEPVDEAAAQPKTHVTSDSQIDEIPAASDDSSPKTEGDKPERDGCTESPLKSVVEADPEPDSPPPSEETHVPVTPEELFEAADGNYLLRLQDILISLHRSYFREYDRWRARKASVNTRMVRQRDDTCDQESSSPSLSSSPSSPLPSSDHQHTETGCVPNLAHIIAQHRANVLGPDCHITLSGLAPSHLPERCFAARIARNLGAVLHGGLRLPPPQSVPVSEESVGVTQSTHKEHSASPVKNLEHEDLVHPPGPRNVYTTHLIACRRGTEKHNAATEFLRTWPSDVSAPPLHIVSPHWLWACHFHWTRFPESDFPLVHDYHPSEFDPELEPAPGTFRYARRHRRHHAEHGPAAPPVLARLTEQQDLFRYHVPHRSSKHHRRSRHHHHHHRKHSRHPSKQNPSESPLPQKCDSTPRLDVSMVQSALESIRAERKLDKQRKHEQHRRRRHSGSSAHVAPPKRHRTYSSQDHNASQSLEPADTNQITPSGEQESKVDKESGSSSPSLSSSEDEQEQPQTRDASRQDSAEIASQDSAAAIVPNPKGHTVDLTEFHKTEEPPHGSGTLVEIRDADEGTEDETLDYVLPGDTVEDEDEEEEEGTTESETAIESNLSAFLPPPKALILADNPLLHLPPQATSQMLAEIEDAVMEEDTEKAASVPVEAELFDPAKLGVCNTDSSLSSSEQDVTEEGAEQVEDMIQLHEEDRIPAQRPRIRRSRSPMRRVDPVELDQRALQCQVQRELLLRRRCRASPEETRKIDRKLHRLDAYLRREDWRRRSADDLAFVTRSYRTTANHSAVQDTDSEDSDIWDADYPKGWGPETRSHSLHGFRSHTTPRSVSVSPAIHSDPEPSLDWWRSEDAQACDFREWNTCPEGYDYEDAERTRALLMRDARADELRSYAERLHKTHRSLTRCLFGTDDEGDASNEEDDAENDEPSDSSVEESDDPEEDEDLDHERWEPLREFM
ncbi:hypothetical protein CSKR_202287 [Clonorchis sinensis]|uniref:protein-serine/threonine phosphatase n=1 Tax=Clonorchis sinensis TaxID=79923 RepID=A0A8T1MV52_CLOSI|nr:hypothetical protein CSKR_202287 [Clonorchis sinensis]